MQEEEGEIYSFKLKKVLSIKEIHRLNKSLKMKD